MRVVTAEDTPQPRVVFLSEQAIRRPDLSEDGPVILCVDNPLETGPVADHPLPQRRIALLAIEQMAWVLAARDPRCVVVDSRTELDWAMRHGRISVWAPSKLVLDAHDGPAGAATEPLTLAVWLANAMAAREFLVFGPGGPHRNPDCPVTRFESGDRPDVRAFGADT